MRTNNEYKDNASFLDIMKSVKISDEEINYYSRNTGLCRVKHYLRSQKYKWRDSHPKKDRNTLRILSLIRTEQIIEQAPQNIKIMDMVLNPSYWDCVLNSLGEKLSSDRNITLTLLTGPLIMLNDKELTADNIPTIKFFKDFNENLKWYMLKEEYKYIIISNEETTWYKKIKYLSEPLNTLKKGLLYGDNESPPENCIDKILEQKDYYTVEINKNTNSQSLQDRLIFTNKDGSPANVDISKIFLDQNHHIFKKDIF